ncbi:MAG: RNA polymerase sigma factor [Planctomycetes bacterium]|nr:RNA polymerase sigma factor [Planctomycetota bacterium]
MDSDIINTEVHLKISQGEEETWQHLYDKYYDAITRYCTQYVRCQDEAEDIAQQTFIKLKQNMDKFDSGRPLRPWLYRIARNSCLDHKQKKRPGLLLDKFSDTCFFNSSRLDIRVGGPSPATEIQRQDLHSCIMQELDSLSEEHRSVFLMKYVEGLSRTEIAEALDVPEATVKSRLYYGMKKIKEVAKKFEE